MKSCVRVLCASGILAVLIVVTRGLGIGQTVSHPRPHPKSSASAAPVGTANATSKYKGIWEPMNYPDDIHIEDVYFANDQVGWISGKGTGGFLLHTTDGGQHWEPQLGDPHSDDAEIWGLHFLDATHGWAVQGGALIRTTDGRTWQTIGPFAPNNPLAGYRFISVKDGFEIAGYYTGSSVFATHDGGRSWKQTYQCAATIQVNGLNRNTSCMLNDIYFPSVRVGYAVGGEIDAHFAAVVKTVDGGTTWKLIFASTDLDQATAVFFTDENNGVIRLHDRQVFVTSDGGQSWHGGSGAADANFKFADPQVGLSCNLDAYQRCAFTTDGGNSWTTHNLNFPTDISGYSVPRRDSIYVVGDHGMIYHYRTVPGDYTAKGILDAPLLPAYGGPIVDRIQEMQTQVAALRTKLAGASAAQPPAGSNGPQLQNVSFNATADPSSPQSSSAQSSFAQPQDSGAAPASASTGGFTQEASAGGFVQDTSDVPPGQFVQNCCATQVQGLQTSFTSFAQQVPPFGGKFRNLNLLVVGLNMLSDLVSKGKQMGAAFTALKQAPDAQSALAALASLSSSLQNTSQAITSGFQNLTLGPATGGFTGVTNAVQGAGQPGAPTADPNAPPAANPTAAASPNSSATDSVQDQAQKAMDKLKKKIPW